MDNSKIHEVKPTNLEIFSYPKKKRKPEKWNGLQQDNLPVIKFSETCKKFGKNVDLVDATQRFWEFTSLLMWFYW